MEKIQIRSAHLSDAKALAEINLLCWQKNYRELIDNKFLDALSMTDKRIERFQEQIKESAFCFCATQNKQIVGYLSAYKNTNKEIPATYEIRYLYIHPDFQHQGIGQKLIQRFQQKIKNRPFYLYMLERNKQGEKFYQKRGGIHAPQFDQDTEVLNLKMHEVCWIFNPKG